MIVGIDLGTTNSAIGIWRDGQAELIPNSLGHLLTPSAVGLDNNGDLLVGLPARERQATHPDLTVTAFKRFMGTRRATKLGKQSFLPEELSALVLRNLKADAEAYLGEEITEAVITVPAYFSDKQRKATRRAGELAGLKVERLLNEPTAAALAYGIHKLEDESRFLVFDLGGGTFDVSILEIFEGVIEVRASTGDNRLGGEDFNDLLIKAMKDRFAKSWKVNPRTEKAHHQILRAAAEKARRALSEKPSATMQIVWQGEQWEHEISEGDFDRLAQDLLERMREPVLRSLRDSDIRPDDLQEIVLVGGATRMPLIRRAVTRMFGRFPSLAVHPDEAVAIGAAIQAGLKARNADLKEVAVTDVCPYTLGVDITERGPDDTFRPGIFAPIIERNTTVPASRVKSFVTIKDKQPSVRFNIFQGESRHVENNIALGTLQVPVPPLPAGEVSIECRFTYDINGLIEVDVLVPATGERRQLVIVDEEGTSGDDLDCRRAALASLKIHPREADANRAALARAARCYENNLGDKRDHIGAATAMFESVLDTQDPRQVEKARAEFMTLLDAIDGESFL